MRGIKLRIEIGDFGIKLGHRYSVVVGDGGRSERFTIANDSDVYSKPQWSILGNARRAAEWSTDSQNMYVRIERQYPNPEFDFSPEQYQRHGWLDAELDISNFRLYNPVFARPFLQWSDGMRWGDEIAFSERDQQQFQYSVNEYQFKHNENGVQWTVRRNDDSDDFKEFVVRLSV